MEPANTRQHVADIALHQLRPTTSLAVMLSVARERGIDEEALLAAAGMDRAAIESFQVEISSAQEIRFIESLLARCDDPDLGIACGRRYRISSHGIFGYMLMTSPTLRAALELGTRFLPLSTGLSRMEFVVQDEVVIRINIDHLPPAIRRFVAERDAIAAAMVFQDLTGDRIPLSRCWLAHGRPAPEECYAGLAQATVEFDRPEYLVAFSCQLLDTPLPLANPTTHTRCVNDCLALLEQRRNQIYLDGRIRSLVMNNLADPLDFEQIAEIVGIHPRTLRRQLREEGTTYREILEEARKEMATRMLTSTGIKTQEIALRLGYKDPPTFSAAFKRWTGQTPTGFRDARSG